MGLEKHNRGEDVDREENGRAKRQIMREKMFFNVNFLDFFVVFFFFAHRESPSLCDGYTSLYRF